MPYSERRQCNGRMSLIKTARRASEAAEAWHSNNRRSLLSRKKKLLFASRAKPLWQFPASLVIIIITYLALRFSLGRSSRTASMGPQSNERLPFVKLDIAHSRRRAADWLLLSLSGDVDCYFDYALEKRRTKKKMEETRRTKTKMRCDRKHPNETLYKNVNSGRSQSGDHDMKYIEEIAVRIRSSGSVTAVSLATRKPGRRFSIDIS